MSPIDDFMNFIATNNLTIAVRVIAVFIPL